MMYKDDVAPDTMMIMMLMMMLMIMMLMTYDEQWRMMNSGVDDDMRMMNSGVADVHAYDADDDAHDVFIACDSHASIAVNSTAQVFLFIFEIPTPCLPFASSSFSSGSLSCSSSSFSFCVFVLQNKKVLHKLSGSRLIPRLSR